MTTDLDRPMRVAMFVTNTVDVDTRVLKQARALMAAGHEVRVFGWALSLESEGLAVYEGVTIHRLCLPFAARKGRKVRAAMPAVDSVVPLWRAAYRWLRRSFGGNRRRGIADLIRRPGEQAVFVIGLVEWLLGSFRRPFRSLTEWRAAPSYLTWYRRSAAYARAWGADVLHCHDLNAAPAALLAARGGRSLVYDSHELWLDRTVRPDRWIWTPRSVERVLERMTLQRSDISMTVSEHIRAHLIEQYGTAADGMLLVRNIPAGTKAVAPGLRQLAGLSKSTKILLYVGSVTLGRGLVPTLEVLALLPEEWKLVLLGPVSSAFSDELEREIAELELGNRTIFLDPVLPDLVAPTIADADVSVVFIEPISLSYVYSLPNKLFESIHAGVPVVASDLPEISGIVRRYRVGEVVDHLDAEAAAEAVLRVHRDREIYAEHLGMATQELTWDQEVARLVAAYTKLEFGSGRPRWSTRAH